jgi:Family of unknown function (DUF5908)
MPVTINEVEINTTVADTSNANQEGGKDAKKGGGMSPEEMDNIISACMLKVRQLLDDLKER